MAPTLENLKKYTSIFFENHWDKNLLGEQPVWSKIHTDFSKSIPNFDKQGVYAFVMEDNITYIGVGASRCSGLYRGNGLSARVMKYCRYVDGVYSAVDERLKEAGALITMGFDVENAYMAHSLEVYLISKLEPKYNIVKAGM